MPRISERRALEQKFEPLRDAFRYDDGSKALLEAKNRYWGALCLITLT
ncbi:hypothetical protein ACFV2I_33405 [Streptomyces microflavus]